MGRLLHGQLYAADSGYGTMELALACRDRSQEIDGTLGAFRLRSHRCRAAALSEKTRSFLSNSPPPPDFSSGRRRDDGPILIAGLIDELLLYARADCFRLRAEGPVTYFAAAAAAALEPRYDDGTLAERATSQDAIAEIAQRASALPLRDC